MSILIKGQDLPSEGYVNLIAIKPDGTVYNSFGRELTAQAIQFDENAVNPWRDANKPPVVGDLVIVSVCDESGDTPYDYTSVGWYSGYDNKWVVDDEFNNYVYAWMPFPEPKRRKNKNGV